MTDTTYQTTTTGLFPLPDGAKDDLLDAKGRQRNDLIDGTEGQEIERFYDTARRTVLEWQGEAGIDRFVEGQLRWDDMLAHPLAVHDAVKTGGLRRYYDNNNFYRDVRVTGPLTADGDITRDLFAAADIVDSDRLQAVFPGPLTLFDLGTDEHYGSPEAFLDGITTFLVEEVSRLPSVETVVFLEPSLAAGRMPVEVADASEAIRRVIRAASDAEVTDVLVQTPWGVPDDDTYGALLDSDGVGIGFDLVADLDAARSLVSDYGAPETVGLGVIDGQNTLIETEADVRERTDQLLSVTGDVTTAYLTFNTEGFYLPTNRFREKLATLGNVVPSQEVAP